MDLTLIRTFLEVSASGSFVAASTRLFVTQSAVSLRIQRLEDTLGQPLFTRSKAGAELTAAGRAFERYALSLMRTWEEARQQIAIPEGYTDSITLGAQHSLWPRLGFRWIDALRRDLPRLSIRAEIGMPDRLTRFLIEGAVDAALVYTPQMRPDLSVEKLIADELILVAAWEDPTLDLGDRYVFVDWGAEFVQAHALRLPGLTNPGITLTLGALAADFIRVRGLAAYVPARFAKRFLDAGTLHLVPDAPTFNFPIWVAWRDDIDADLAGPLRGALLRAVREAEGLQGHVLSELADLNEDGQTRDAEPATKVSDK